MLRNTRLYQDQKVPARMKLFGEGKDWFQISKKTMVSTKVEFCPSLSWLLHAKSKLFLQTSNILNILLMKTAASACADRLLDRSLKRFWLGDYSSFHTTSSSLIHEETWDIQYISDEQKTFLICHLKAQVLDEDLNTRKISRTK